MGGAFPKHLLANFDPATVHAWDFWTRPVGDGPYQFVRYQPGTMMELEAYQGYYRGKPMIQRVVLKFAGANALTELLGGGVVQGLDRFLLTDPIEHFEELWLDDRSGR